MCQTETLERVTIQRNRIQDPRYSANSWTDGHPAGPQAVTISYCGGNHVIRHNEMYSTNIYGNRLSHSWDDGIEAEGGNKNVRIWGNFIDRSATAIATTVVATGPVYIFRNVFNAFGQGVTFTVKVTGGSGTPTGTVNFQENGASIPGCSSVALNGSGIANCTTSALAPGSHAIKGIYAGSLGPGVAGPITQTVN